MIRTSPLFVLGLDKVNDTAASINTSTKKIELTDIKMDMKPEPPSQSFASFEPAAVSAKVDPVCNEPIVNKATEASKHVRAGSITSISSK